MAYGKIETYGFEISYEPDGVYFQLQQEGPFTVGDIMRWVLDKKIQDTDIVLLDTAVNKQDYEKIKIAPPQEEKLVDQSISVYLEDQDMKAYVILHQGDAKGKQYSQENLVTELAEKHGVEYGIDEKAIADLIAKQPYEEKILVAEGKAPVNGKNGRIEYTFETSYDKKGTQVGDRVDFKELHLFNNVETGDVLATKIPAEPGVKGCNVRGRVLDAMDGKEALFIYGKNVSETGDGTQLIADINGRVDLLSNKVVVSPVYHINGNVDMSTGNIDFAGDITIAGNVLDGFVVKAKGSIEVHGVVENATLMAGKDITIYQGVRGGGKTQLTAGGKVFSRFIEQGSIQANEKIAAESIMHSNVFCAGPIEVVTGKAVILGGNVCSAESITAKDFGADVGVATFISIDLLSSMKERRIVVKERLESLRGDLKKLKLIRGKMMESDIIEPEKKVQILNDIDLLSKEEIALVKEFENLTRLTIKAKEGMINVKGRIYPGVRITMGNATLTVKEPADYVSYKNVGGEIKEIIGRG